MKLDKKKDKQNNWLINVYINRWIDWIKWTNLSLELNNETIDIDRFIQ